MIGLLQWLLWTARKRRKLERAAAPHGKNWRQERAMMLLARAELRHAKMPTRKAARRLENAERRARALGAKRTKAERAIKVFSKRHAENRTEKESGR